jgi:hypothetical protein
MCKICWTVMILLDVCSGHAAQITIAQQEETESIHYHVWTVTVWLMFHKQTWLFKEMLGCF